MIRVFAVLPQTKLSILVNKFCRFSNLNAVRFVGRYLMILSVPKNHGALSLVILVLFILTFRTILDTAMSADAVNARTEMLPDAASEIVVQNTRPTTPRSSPSPTLPPASQQRVEPPSPISSRGKPDSSDSDFSGHQISHGKPTEASPSDSSESPKRRGSTTTPASSNQTPRKDSGKFSISSLRRKFEGTNGKVSQSQPSGERRTFGLRAPTKCESLFPTASWRSIYRSEKFRHQCLHNDGLEATSCLFSQLVLDTNRIVWKGSAIGGEDVESVRGQSEDSEYLKFLPGAFSVTDGPSNTADPLITGKFYMRDAFQGLVSVREVDFDQCDVTLQNVFMTMRYEYANLYHSTTDFFNFFLSMRLFDMEFDKEETHVLFLDAHPSSHMDDFWTSVFANNVDYVGSYRNSRICIENAVFVSEGYSSPLNLIPRFDCGYQPLVREYGEFVVNRFGLTKTLPSTLKTPVVLFEFREDYFAHPRKTGHTSRRILNKDDIVDHMQELGSKLGFYFRPVSCSAMSLVDQISAFRSATVVIAAHGAALSHVLYMTDESRVLEIIPPGYDARTHFLSFGTWAGVQVDRISAKLLPGSHSADDGFYLDPSMLDELLSGIFPL